jgi:hypothetical protein
MIRCDLEVGSWHRRSSSILMKRRNRKIGMSTMRSCKYWYDVAEQLLTISHCFVYKHYSKLQPVLENMPPSYRRSITPRSARADIDGSAALKVIIDLMRTTGEPIEATALNAAARAGAYDE